MNKDYMTACDAAPAALLADRLCARLRDWVSQSTRRLLDGKDGIGISRAALRIQLQVIGTQKDGSATVLAVVDEELTNDDLIGRVADRDDSGGAS